MYVCDTLFTVIAVMTTLTPDWYTGHTKWVTHCSDNTLFRQHVQLAPQAVYTVLGIHCVLEVLVVVASSTGYRMLLLGLRESPAQKHTRLGSSSGSPTPLSSSPEH